MRMSEAQLDEMEREVERLAAICEAEPANKIAAAELLLWLQRNDDHCIAQLYGH